MSRTLVCLLLIGFLSVEIGEGVVAASERSPKKAFLLSLFVPGAGQYYAGEKSWAKRFLITEVALWLSYLGFHTYEDWRGNDYRLFAAHHAGVQPAGKDEEFFDKVGFYASVYEYNRVARWEDGVEAHVYPEEPTPAWEWEDEGARLRFRVLHSSSITAHRRALYVIGGVIIHHVLSGIQAARAVEGSDEPASASIWRLELIPSVGMGMRVVIYRM